MKTVLAFCAILLIGINSCKEAAVREEDPEKREITQETTIDEKMQWFSDAKLGIFIHW